MSVHTPADRLAWLDTARGIGIVLVVMAHVWRGLETSGLLQTSATLTAIDNSVYSFHMPLFFFLAGVTLPASLAAGKRRFLTAKISRIAYPFFLWSMIVGGIMLLVGAHANSPIDAKSVLLSPFIPIQQFWFLQTLFVLQLVALAVGNARILFAISLAAFVAAQVVFPFGGVFFSWLHFLLFLAAGALIGGRMAILGRMPTVLAALGFLASVWLGNASGQFYMAWIYLPAAIFGIALTLGISQHLAGNAAGRVFALLGNMSLTIYVAHIVAASGLRVVLQKIGLPAEAALYLGLCTLAGIVLPVALHLVLQRLDLLWVFGLGKRTARARISIAKPPPYPDREKGTV